MNALLYNRDFSKDMEAQVCCEMVPIPLQTQLFSDLYSLIEIRKMNLLLRNEYKHSRLIRLTDGFRNTCFLITFFEVRLGEIFVLLLNQKAN